MTQGARSNRPQIVEDLDVMVSSRMLRPAKVKLAGREWTIKRDFTPDQVFKFWSLAGQPSKASEAFAMLVGVKDAPALAHIVDTVPVEMISAPLRRLYQLAGLLARPDDEAEENGGDEGEFEAS